MSSTGKAFTALPQQWELLFTQSLFTQWELLQRQKCLEKGDVKVDGCSRAVSPEGEIDVDLKR